MTTAVGRRLTEAAASLDLVLAGLAMLQRQLADQHGGYPASTLRGSPGGGTTSSPVEAAIGHNDPAARDAARLDELSRQVDRACTEMWHMLGRWDPTPHEHPCARSGCVVCGEHPVTLTDAAGVLDDKTGLCRPCREFTARVRRLPEPWELPRAGTRRARLAATTVAGLVE